MRHLGAQISNQSPVAQSREIHFGRSGRSILGDVASGICEGARLGQSLVLLGVGLRLTTHRKKLP